LFKRVTEHSPLEKGGSKAAISPQTLGPPTQAGKVTPLPAGNEANVRKKRPDGDFFPIN
jgi:hypothetical protein